MSTVSTLGYVVFGVSDFDAWANFATNVLGLQIVSRDEQCISLRMDDYSQRVVLENNPIDDLVVAGWEFNTEAELDIFAQNCRDKGVGIKPMEAARAELRMVDKGYYCDDPVMPYVHEFFFSPRIAPLNAAFKSTVLKSSFVTGDLGVGHILPITRDISKTLDFLLNILGLRISDYIREEVAPGFVIDATFLHAKTGRHHSIGVAPADLPKTLNHFMVQVSDLDDVGLAYDRAVNAGCHIELEIGHHPNDQMTSFYVRTPSGFNVEFGYGGLVIDDRNWTVRRFSQLSDWGHRRNLPPERKNSAPLAGFKS